MWQVRSVTVCIGLAISSMLAAQPPENPTDPFAEIGKAIQQGQGEKAVELLTVVLKGNDKQSTAYYLRGREHFRLGKIKESVADFDRHVALSPELEPRQWERGIALYYAGEFARGAKQFELYQTFDNRDVENSVWRFLCMAPDEGVAKAREVMLPIKDDPRVPMMQVFEMFRGKVTPEAVLESARGGQPAPEVLAGRLFYAHLYLGLYFDALGDAEQARKYIELAASDEAKKGRGVNSYMWDVARVHQRQLKEGRKK